MLFLILLSLLLLLESCNSLKVSPPLSSLKCKLSKTKLNLSPGAVSIIKGAATLPVIYSLMSLNEYITHRYYQHAEINKIAKFLGLNFRTKGGGHPEHHAETRDDMSLKTNDENWKKTAAYAQLNSDKYRGTAFSWSVTFLMVIQMMVTTLPLFKMLFGFSISNIMKILLPSVMIHGCVWNTLHPQMHGLPDNNIFEGPPAKLFAKFKNSSYFKYIELNHIGHHIMPCNYNVCCPGTDFLFNTHVPEEIWRRKQKIDEKTSTEELVLN
jgi:hypothetical protein